MINLYEEIKEDLKSHNKRVEDIAIVRCGQNFYDVDSFLKLAKEINYNQGYGFEYINQGLVLEGTDFILKRETYDGSEWFKYVEKTKNIPTVKEMKPWDLLEDFHYSCYMNDKYAKKYEEDFIRNDFKSALQNVKNGDELSEKLEWSFSDEDISNLKEIYKENPNLRVRISDLLENCNFISALEEIEEYTYGKPEPTIETNFGSMPVSDYLDRIAWQNGFDDYKGLIKNGIYIDENWDNEDVTNYVNNLTDKIKKQIEEEQIEKE